MIKKRVSAEFDFCFEDNESKERMLALIYEILEYTDGVTNISAKIIDCDIEDYEMS